MKQNKKNQISRRKFIANTAALSSFFILPRFVLGRGYTPPSDMITLGFIGTGRQAFTLQQAFLKTGEAKILAGCDVYRQKLDAFARQTDEFYAKAADKQSYKACDSYSNFVELLERKDIDAVVISSPDFWHASMAVRAANAGKDIYCEKPLSLTVAEGRAIVNAVNKNKRIFQTGSMQRSWPEFRQTAELIRNGYLGDIKSIQVSVGNGPVPYDLPKEEIPSGLDWDLWLGPNKEYVHYNNLLNPALGNPTWGKWRDYKGMGGGDMTDWGAHMFDIVQWALDMDRSGPVEITPSGVNGAEALTFRYANGITMTKENFVKNRAIRFTGSKGTLDVQRRKLETNPAHLKDQVIGANEIHVYNSTDHYKDFLNAMRKRTQPVADAETGHRSATVCNIGNIALEINAHLKWDPVKEQFTNSKAANKLLTRPMKKEWAVYAK
ncbi:MAG: Gfo/Idh/MocA family oxidoreductase [Niabella sp.]